MENLSHLRQLLSLAETGNYRKAGERLGISHSAISQTVAKLESYYGVGLFKKQNSETTPTVFGERLISSAKIILKEMELAERDLQRIDSLDNGELVLGVDPSVCETLAGPALSNSLLQHPNLTFKIVVTPCGEEISYLREKKIDLFVGIKPDRLADDILYQPISYKPPVLACHADHPLAKTKEVTIRSISGYPCLSGEIPVWLQNEFNKRHLNQGGPFNIFKDLFLTSQSLTLVYNVLLHSKNSIAALPKEFIRKDVVENKLHILDLYPSMFEGPISGVIASANRPIVAPAAIELIATIKRLLTPSDRN